MSKFSFFWTFFVIYQGYLTTALHESHDESGETKPPPFHPPGPGPYPDSADNDDMNENAGESGKLKECEYLAPYNGVMFCAHGCCGSLNDQKCCKNDNEQGLSLANIILLVVVAVLLITIFALIGFCLYKHKKSLHTRRTSPVSDSNPALNSKAATHDNFYTKNTMSTAGKEKMAFVDICYERQKPASPKTPPPRYSERVADQSEPKVQQLEVQPYLDQPPPYFVAVASVAPSSTEL